LNAFSVAFKPLEIIEQETANGVVRIIKRLNLYNIALTGEAANPNTTFKPVMKSLLINYKKEANNMSEEKEIKETKTIDLKSVNKRLDSIEESVKTVIKNKELEDKINKLSTRVETLEKKSIDKPKEEPKDEPKEDKDNKDNDKDSDKPQDEPEASDKEPEKQENTVKSKDSKLKLKSTVEQPKETKGQEVKATKRTNTANVLDLF
jgi:hypothetical protein